METNLSITKTDNSKIIEEYTLTIDNIVESMLSKNQLLSFASIIEETTITPITIKKYPELKKYILAKISHYKELQIIDIQINKAVEKLLKSNQNITFTSIVQKCNFSSSSVYQNSYIKRKILNAISKNPYKKD